MRRNVTKSDEVDPGILALVQQVLEQPDTKTNPHLAASLDNKTEIPPSAPKRDPGHRAVSDTSRSPEELAAIILNALRTIDDCPTRGFLVTVYGLQPWNAMLTITPEAGRVENAALWRERVKEMAVRLRRDYSVKSD